MVLDHSQGVEQEFRKTIEMGQDQQMSLWQELTWLSLILIIGVSTRLLFITFFPTTPISDFSNLLNFAIIFRGDLIAKNVTHWRYFSPGFPLILSVLLRIGPDSPDTVGRWATAISTG